MPQTSVLIPCIVGTLAIAALPSAASACGLRLSILGGSEATAGLRPMGQALNATPAGTQQQLDAARQFDATLARTIDAMPGSEDTAFVAVSLERMVEELATCATRNGGALDRGGLASRSIDSAIQRSLPGIVAVLRARDGNRTAEPGAGDAMMPLLHSQRVRSALIAGGHEQLIGAAEAEVAQLHQSREELRAIQRAEAARQYELERAEAARQSAQREAERQRWEAAERAERIRNSPRAAVSAGIRATPTQPRPGSPPDAYQIRKLSMEIYGGNHAAGNATGFASFSHDFEAGTRSVSMFGTTLVEYYAVDEVNCVLLRAGSYRCSYRIVYESNMFNTGPVASRVTNEFTLNGSQWESRTIEAEARGVWAERNADDSRRRNEQQERDQQLRGWGCAINPSQPGC